MMDLYAQNNLRQIVSRYKPALLQIEHHISPVIGNAIKAKIKAKQWYRYSRHHAAELNPYRILWIDPDEVHGKNKKVVPKSEFDLSHVIGGDWDINQTSFESNYIYKSFENRFENDADWKETELYQNILRKVERREYVYNCYSESDLERRCEYLDELYETIATSGFRPNHEVHMTPPRRIDAYRPTEIKVKIGRTGKFYYCNGRHRLCIAKLQDINKIPVTVVVRHTDWQAYRNRVVRSLQDEQSAKETDLPDDNKSYREHPDIAYLT